MNSGGRKIKLWGEDRSGRAKCEMRGSGKEIMAPTQGGGEFGYFECDIITSLSLTHPAWIFHQLSRKIAFRPPVLPQNKCVISLFATGDVGNGNNMGLEYAKACEANETKRQEDKAISEKPNGKLTNC